MPVKCLHYHYKGSGQLPYINYNTITLYIARGRNEKFLEKMERNYKRYSYGYRVAVVCRICDFRGDE